MEARLESPRRLPESPCIGMVCLSTFKGVDKSAKILLDKVEQVLGLAEKFERGFWELNQTSKSLTSLEENIF